MQKNELLYAYKTNLEPNIQKVKIYAAVSVVSI